jgi:hypothetical protein
MQLIFVFEPNGGVRGGDRDRIRSFLESELDRLGSPWRPTAEVRAPPQRETP